MAPQHPPSQVLLCYPEPRGCLTPSQWMLLGRFFSQVSITAPSLQAEVGSSGAQCPPQHHRSITAFRFPLRGDE